jgi:competence protein ComEA
MNAEQSDWHSFGDSPAPGETAPPPGAAQAAPAVGASPARPISGAGAHRNAWLAVGATIVATVIGLAVFVTTVAMAGTGNAGEVVIAARSQASPRGAASALPSEGHGRVVPGSVVLVVDVEGAVRVPGLHQVATGSRIGDAITAAGGYADRADLAAAAQTLNLAQPLVDGAKIHVPLLGELADSVIDGGNAPTSAPANDGGHPPPGLIDLNHADQAALESLPGIGPVTAGKIIAARESGPFASLDDVVSRKALSASTMDKVRSLVTVGP